MLPREPTPSALEDEITGWFAARRVVRPGTYRLDRLIRSVRAGHDDAVLAAIADRLDDTTRSRLDALVADHGEGTAYTRLSADPGKAGLDSLLAEIAKLEWVRGLGRPSDLLAGVHPELITVPSTGFGRERVGTTPSSGSYPAPATRPLLRSARAREAPRRRCPQTQHVTSEP